MYKITLFGKLRDFKHQDNFCVETDKELSVKKLKNLICVYLRDQNPNNNEEIGPIIKVSALSDNERILTEDEIVNPGNISLLPPVSGG